MDISKDDRELIEKYEYTTAKVDLLQLQKVYNRYNIKQYKDCLCTSLRCKIFRKVFDEWYNSTK